MPPAINGITNTDEPLRPEAHLTAYSLKIYGPNIYNNVFIGEFEWLKRSCLVADGNFSDFRTLQTIANDFMFEKRQSAPDFNAQARLVDAGFCAYLVWMSKKKFDYKSDQSPPAEYFDFQAEDILDYTIFFPRNRPTGNCTQVNKSLGFLLQFLGIHPKYLFLTSVGCSDNSDAYVITKDVNQINQMKVTGALDTQYESKLKLPHYVSKTLELRPNSCKVKTSSRETPFPNHQYLKVNIGSLHRKYYDARCGYRYLDSMGIFEFWKINGKIKYVNKNGEKCLARIVEPFANAHAANANLYTVEAPDVCWPSITSVTKMVQNKQDPNSVCWFYVEGTTTYGVNDTSVKLEDGKERALPYHLACVYGYFIKDAELGNLIPKIRETLDSYEGRSFLGLRKPSQQSIDAVRLLRSWVGGSKTDKKSIDKYYRGETVNPQGVSPAALRDALYALLRTADNPQITPLKRDGALFAKLADSLKMPDYLR